MEFQKLKPDDFTLNEEKFTFFHNERDPGTGEDVLRHTYTSRCKLLNRNIKLTLTIDNPENDLKGYLEQFKTSLEWVDNNRSSIYATMNAARAQGWFNSEATRKMSETKFIEYLKLEEVRIFQSDTPFSIRLVTLRFNKMEDYGNAHFALDFDILKKHLSAYHLGC